MLPEKFVIKWEKSDSFKEFIKWLNAPERADGYYAGNSVKAFYGITSCIHGNNLRNTACSLDLQSFEKGTVLLTADEWKMLLEETSYEIY